MLAHSRDGACLRSFVAFVLGHDEPHFGTGFELVEAWIGHRVAVEIDLLAFGCLDEAVSTAGDGPISRKAIWIGYVILLSSRLFVLPT